MKKTKIRILIAFCTCIIILLVFKSIQLSLKQPIYYRYLVEHYLPSKADSVYETSTINLKYITNIWDKTQITKVTFDKHPELTASIYNSQAKQYGIYKVVNVILYIEWDPYAVGTQPNVAKVNNIKVTYSNQRSQLINIGKLYFYSGENTENILDAVDCLPLYNLERLQTYKANENVLIKGFSPVTLEFIEAADIIESLSFTYENYNLIKPSKPIMVSNKNPIIFKMKLKGLEKKSLISLESNFDYYEIEPQIELYDEFGNTHFVTIFNPYINLEFKNYHDVKNYLQRRK